ncbi:MAG: hypothetical protein ACP5OX_02230 [Minisyncoccia bacterium]
MQIPQGKNFFQTFWGGVVVVILIIAAVYFIYNSLKGKGVNFLVEGSDTVKSGEILDLHLIYNNNTRIVLQAAEIEVKLPEGVIFLEEPNKEVVNFYLGEINPKSFQDKLLKVLVTGEPKTTKTLQAVFRYRPKTLTSTFEIPLSYNILIIGSTFDLEANFPKEVFLGQSFPLEVKWNNLSNQAYDNIEIKANWPEGFDLVNSTPETASESEKNQWKLGTVLPNGSGKLEITGLLSGEAGETKKIYFTLGVRRDKDFLPLEKTESFVTLASNPLEIETLVNQQKNYVANLGETLNVTIKFKNNYTTFLRNLVLKTTFNSDILDFNTLRAPKALFSLRTQTLTWDGSKVEELYSLSPQESGALSFSIRLKRDWPMVSLAQKNPIIEIRTTLESSNTPEGAPVSDLPRAFSVNDIKVNTQCDLAITSYFRDALSGIANQGNLPLKVDEPTDFTIHFKVFNTFNNVKNLKIKTRLPQGVEFTSQIAGNYGDNLPSYDKNTRQFVWEVPNVSLGSGYLIKAPELIFQVRATPQYSQINEAITLIEETTMTGIDTFTLEEINKTYPPIKTDRLTDKTVYPFQGIVQP